MAAHRGRPNGLQARATLHRLLASTIVGALIAAAATLAVW